MGLTHHQTFYGSGGISSLSLGLSASLSTAFHIGARLNYIYGRTRQYQTDYFDDPNYVSPSFDRSAYFSGFTFTFGTIYESVGKLLGISSLNNFSIGLTATTPATLDADEDRTYQGAAAYSNDSIVIKHGNVELPITAGLGISYMHQDRYRFLGDLTFQNWANTKYFGKDLEEIRNSYRTSFGFELAPLKGTDSYWSRISYRIGFAYHSTYYKIHGVGIDEIMISGGLGFPMGAQSKLNIGLQFGIRGTTDSKLQKDNIFRLSIAISASELWFQKYEEE
jgi:hypothetical protein